MPPDNQCDKGTQPHRTDGEITIGKSLGGGGVTSGESRNQQGGTEQDSSTPGAAHPWEDPLLINEMNSSSKRKPGRRWGKAHTQMWK